MADDDKKPKASVRKSYRALVGISYPDPKKPGSEKQAEEGDILTDLPPTSLEWLLDQNLVKEV